MSTVTSTRYVSASATGENWRDIAKKILEELDLLKTGGFHPNIGFLYLTDALAADAGSILTLFRSVTGIDNWTGCAAMGVLAAGIEYVDVPAISVLIGQVSADHVRPFHAPAHGVKKLQQELEPWLNRHDPMLVVVHADPLSESHPAEMLEEIDTLVGGFMVGGLSSSRTEGVIISKEITETGVSGFVFSQDVAVASALTQGCMPMGPIHEVSGAQDQVVTYLDGRRPFDVFSEDMKNMAHERLGYKPDETLMREGPDAPRALMQLLEGEAHVAFPVPGSDVRDYTVRNILAIDPDNGMIAVGEHLEDGRKMMFVYRDDETVRADLSATLVSLQKRVLHDNGAYAPKAALYVSCVCRAGTAFREGQSGGEMALIREILGDIPIAGFYANGEISNNRLYGYTGVLTLFL